MSMYDGRDVSADREERVAEAAAKAIHETQPLSAASAETEEAATLRGDPAQLKACECRARKACQDTRAWLNTAPLQFSDGVAYEQQLKASATIFALLDAALNTPCPCEGLLRAGYPRGDARMKIEYPVMHANDCLTRRGGPCNCRCTVFSEVEFAGLTPRQEQAIIRLKLLAEGTPE